MLSANLIPSHACAFLYKDWEQIDYDVIDVKYIHLTEIVDLIQKKQIHSAFTSGCSAINATKTLKLLYTSQVLWDETFVNTSKAVQMYFIDTFLR